jgi:hypothetical protein
MYIDDINTLTKFMNVNINFFNSLVYKKYLSYSIYNNYELDNIKISPIVCYFGNSFNKNSYYSLDINKAYTDAIMNIFKIPVFNYFDIWQKYNDEPIEELTQYIVYSKYNDDINNFNFSIKI